MRYIKKVKEGDCFICAYASSEGVTWKQSLRRCRRKGLTNKKFGNVSHKKLCLKGLKNYKFIEKGEFKSLAHMFNFKQGILIVNWGNGSSHALFFNGYKLICHEDNGPLHNMNCFNFKLPKSAFISEGLIKENTSIFNILKNYFIYYLLRIKALL